MVTEAWLVELGKATPQQRQHALSVPPSNHPARKEVALVTLYHGTRMTVHAADIIRIGRKKPVLGPWKTMPMTDAQGRLADPPPDWN